MIPTLYRRPGAPTDPAAVFDPAAPIDHGSIDELRGAVPTWRLEDDPVFWELVRDGLASVDVAAAAVEVVPWLLERLVDDDALVVDVSGSSRLDEDVESVAADVVELPTRALRLVDSVADVDEPVVECPACGATGLDPCRPRTNSTGTPLPRWHAARRRLLEQRDTGSSGVGVLFLLVLALVAVVVAGMLGLLSTAVDRLEQQVPGCVVPTSSQCPDGPGGAR